MFRDRGIASVSQLRALRDSDRTLDDGYGETFLIVDNLYAFSRDNTDQFNTETRCSPGSLSWLTPDCRTASMS